MGSARLQAQDIPIELSAIDQTALPVDDLPVTGGCDAADDGTVAASASVISQPLQVGAESYLITCVSMGNPHAVVFCNEIDSLNLQRIGPLFEHHVVFPDRVNTEFVEVMGRNHLKMRVWERGSGETMACGTGACASAVAAVLNGLCDKDTDIKVQLLGGNLIIRYTDQAVFMSGDCVTVFEGVVEV
jgi:carbamoyl-phosphate synthase large subunit